MKIKKGDSVIVIAGNYKNKTGKVLKTFPQQSRIIIEGVNLHKKHSRPTQKNPQGGIVEKEAPIHISNVMLLDIKTGEPTRVAKKVILDDKTGKRKIARVCKKSGEMIS